ncbi:hypothetical protein [Sphingosinithalassobacter portus]|uniref:hypothetical protein n=1 Tax=Stakelama portus TaxID=2676234 RepID=UPI0011AB4C10|nr:hypothetical protein [Sphingosinithalassobacter portus]
MAKRGSVKLNIQRGAGVAEFRQFLADLESAYLALYFLPVGDGVRRLSRRLPLLIDYMGIEPFEVYFGNPRRSEDGAIYPKDQLEIAAISIHSPGWVELIGSLNPLQQIREYLKDRHERKKDRAWRSETEKHRALVELEILRLQAERERTGVISDFYELLERMDISPEERQRILWDRLGKPMSQLAHHQDTGLLGSQNDNIDGVKD